MGYFARTPKSFFDFSESQGTGVFWAANFEYRIRFLKFKMAEKLGFRKW